MLLAVMLKSADRQIWPSTRGLVHGTKILDCDEIHFRQMQQTPLTSLTPS